MPPRAARLEDVGLLTIALACGSWALPRPARACGATPCAQRQAVMPADGATSVPTNTELRVLYFGTFTGHMAGGTACGLPLSPMRLVDDRGVAVDIEATEEAAGQHQQWWVARPPEPLRANARYRLQTRISSGNSCACDDPAVYSDVSEFTTGAGQDTEAPDLAAIDRLDLAELVDTTNTCGGTHGYPVGVVLAPSAPRAPEVSFDIHVEGRLIKRYASLEHELFVDCGTSALSLQTMLSSGERVQLRAVDLAGNVAAFGPEIIVAGDCTRGDGAAGNENAGTIAGGAAPTTPAPDAVGRDDAGPGGTDMRTAPPTNTVAPSGCAVAHTGTRAPGVLLGWLIVLAAAFVRRRPSVR
jgi:MYXO-CTERM domain-containing protein